MKRVMIVDDAMFMRMVLRGMLEKNGYEVVGEAKDGIEAISAYERLKPDLVTMDITMPNMNGVQAVTGILVFDPKAKIIMCSAMGQRALIRDALKAGAKEFIVKPFQEDRVLDALSRMLRTNDLTVKI
jgi:two-component system, chemotaxis family, chemotaxis protein CheY